MDMEWLGLLEDIELGSVDKHTWSIHFYQPWVYQALPRRDWDIVHGMIKVYLPKSNRVFHEGAMQNELPCEFLVFSVSPL